MSQNFLNETREGKPMATARKQDGERTPQELLEEVQQRAAAQEEVLQDYLKQIRNLQGAAETVAALERGNKELLSKAKSLETELDMYRALIKGWPKGRKLIKLLTRDPYDY